MSALNEAVLRLFPAKPEHAALFWQIRQEAATRRFNPLDDLGIPELARRLSDTGKALSVPHNGEYRYMVAYDNQIIGTVSLGSVSWRMGYGTIGYMLGEAHHGKGLGTKSVALWVDTIFQETPLVRLHASIAEDNVASWRLAERLGFVREGLFREHFVINNQRVSQLQYGLLKSEWRCPAATRTV